MATFGHTATDADGMYHPDNTCDIVFSRFKMGSTPGTAQSISAYADYTGGSDFAMAIYDDGLNLIANTETVTFEGGVGWFSIPISCSLIADAYYYLAAQIDADDTYGYTNTSALYEDYKILGIDWIDPVVKDKTVDGKELMMYVTYETASQDMVLSGFATI